MRTEGTPGGEPAPVTPTPRKHSVDTAVLPGGPVTWNGIVVPSVADEPDHGNDRFQGSPED